MQKLLIIISALIWGIPAFSQQSEVDDIVTEFPDKIQVSLVNTYRDFNILAGVRLNSTVSYRNTSISTGLRLRFGKIGLAFHVPIKHINPSSGSKSDGLSLGFNIYPGNFNISALVRSVKGFEQQLGTTANFRYDVEMTHFLGAISYVLDKDKFSMKAPFRFFEKQNESGGSMIAVATTNFMDLHATDSLFQLKEDVFSKVHKVRMLSVGAGAGYGYTFTKNNWYLTPMATAGMDLNRRRYFNKASENILSDWRVKPVLISQVSGGYNSDKYFVGLVSYYRPGFGSQVNLDASFYRFRVALVAGMRINKPVLKKRK